MKHQSTLFSASWFAASVLVPACVIVVPAHGQTIWHVDDDATGGGGTSWGGAFQELTDALDVAQTDDEIRIAQGRYTPAPPGGDRGATFQLPHGLAVYGGYAGVNHPSPDLRDVESFPTILSGDLNGDDLAGFVNNEENSYHVVTLDAADGSTLLDGVTITAGNANAGGPVEQSGGGMFIENGSPTLHQCTFAANRAAFFGGGLFNDNGSPWLIRCTFVANEAAAAGGGIANFGPSSAATFTNCRFIANAAFLGGGMDNAAGATPALFNCAFIGNSAMQGGAINISGGSVPSFMGCTIMNNVAEGFGGGIHLFPSDAPQPFDRPEYDARRVMPDALVSVPLTNCIVWHNVDVAGSVLVAQLTDSNRTIDAFDVAYSCIRSFTAGKGNIGFSPRFMNADGPDDISGTSDDDIRLGPNSPCIDKGDPGFQAEPHGIDLLGHPRVLCNRVDIGAAEFGIGDTDCDRDVDLVDFSIFQLCFTGAGGVANDGCGSSDFDGDGDVDIDDYSGFGEVVTSPNSIQGTAERPRGEGRGKPRV